MSFIQYLWIALFLLTVIAVMVPNTTFDTSSCKKNWVVVFLVVACLAGIRKHHIFALAILGLLGLLWIGNVLYIQHIEKKQQSKLKQQIAGHHFDYEGVKREF